MDLRCPKCRGVFGQFTGCAALTCAYASCNAHFCAFCLADCGGDAHPHVRTCRLNPKQNEYFVSEAECDGMVDAATPGLRRSTVNEEGDNEAVSAYRNSQVTTMTTTSG